MADPVTWQQQLEVLAHGEVHLLLFATDVERGERLGVQVVLLSPPDDVTSSGHTSTLPVVSRWFDLPDDRAATAEQVREVRAQTVVAFASRLREVLAPPHPEPDDDG